MKTIKNIGLIIGIVFKVKPLLAVAFIVIAITSGLCSPLQIFATQRLLDAVGVLVKGGNIDGIWLYGGLLVFSIFLLQLEGFFYQLLGSKRYVLLEKAIPLRMIDKLMRTHYSAFEDPENQNMFERIKREPPFSMIHNSFGMLIVTIQAFVNIFGTLAMFINANPFMGLGAVVFAVPIFVLGLYVVHTQRQTMKNTTVQQRRAEYIDDLYADKHALYEMKLFDSGAYLRTLWKQSLRNIHIEFKRVFNKISVAELAVRLLMVVFIFYAVMTLTSGLLGHAVGTGQFIALIGALPLLTDRLYMGAMNVSAAVRGALYMEDYRAFFALPEEDTNGTAEPTHCDITFEHVGFSYPNGTDVLRDVHLRIPAGQRVALVGENGAGKSTIVKLLCGLYAPTRGRILIGGVDLQTLSIQARRRFLSVVFQDMQSYELTLRENVAFGNLDKFNDEAALLSALEAANATHLFEGFSKGLDMPLGKLEADGVDLARGEWQRLAFARALVSDANTIILDEPTAALDPIAESRMYEAFTQVLAGRGAVMISHRLASARLAERILVLDGGTIVEDGSHESLMTRGGLYRRMYEAQSSWYTENNAQEANV